MSELIKKRLAELEAKIAKKEAEIAAMGITLEEAEAANALVLEILDSGKAADNKEALTKALEDSEMVRLVNDIERYKETLEADLFEATARYIVTKADTRLLSPAGFSANEKVFVRNPVIKLVDSLNGVSGKNLVAYDMTESEYNS